jgi:hypothetical protein
MGFWVVIILIFCRKDDKNRSAKIRLFVFPPEASGLPAILKMTYYWFFRTFKYEPETGIFVILSGPKPTL